MRTALHAVTIALSATLLFLVEPMAAKAFLPAFGGAAGVWVACVLFFQLALLAGYAYAFALTHFLPNAAQRATHIVIAITATLLLPWTTPVPHAAGAPVWSIVVSLAAAIGLPFFALSATSPLVQSWYSETPQARFPYRLFALSNAASLVALIAYPTLIEPASLLAFQFRAWSFAFIAFAALVSSCAIAATAPNRAATVRELFDTGPNPSPLWWIALSACAAALWPALANHLSQQVAPIPFLWVLPLALYLLTFILCFESSSWYRPKLFRYLLPLACAAFAWRLALRGPAGGIALEIPVLLAALFICCMFCHGELATLKPPPGRGLTHFYLMVALGGAVGAAFVAVIAPNIFDAYLELPVAVVACVLLSLRLLYRIGTPRQILRLSLVGALAFVVASRYTAGRENIYRERNFYGALQVVDSGAGYDAVRLLYHGRILHGAEFLAPGRTAVPTAYYGVQSGAASALGSIRTPNRRVGIVGLGAGTLAAYGRPGDVFHFYDIDSAVVDVARTYFHFLDHSQARIETTIADGRLAIARSAPSGFDALLLDAFSGDSIPVHLLTREAFQLYFSRLVPDGVLAIHVTNRYLNVASVVIAAAADQHKPFRLIHSDANPETQTLAADWVVIENRDAPQPHQLPHLWTDEYSNLFSILK